MNDRKWISRTPAIGVPFDLAADKMVEAVADVLMPSLQIVDIDTGLRNAVRENQAHNQRAVDSYAISIRRFIDLNHVATVIAKAEFGYESEAKLAYKLPVLA
jgi:hypothetical protein